LHELSRIETRLPIRCSRDLVWNTFLDFNRWATLTGVYERLQWTDGIPWAKGSRADLQLLVPARIKTHIRVLHHEPQQSLRWLYHGNGITCNEGFDLYVGESGITQLHAFCDFTGEHLVHYGKRPEQAVGELFWFTFQEFRKACEAITSRQEREDDCMHQAVELLA